MHKFRNDLMLTVASIDLKKNLLSICNAHSVSEDFTGPCHPQTYILNA